MKKNIVAMSLFVLFGNIFAAVELSMPEFSFTLYKGRAAHEYCDTLIEMGDRIWKEYPYFWVPDISPAGREDQVGFYKRSLAMIAVVARTSSGDIVGLTVGLPLKDYRSPDIFNAADELTTLIKNPADTCFYIAETMVEKQWRHKGIASKLYEALEAEVQTLGLYQGITRLIAEHPDHHLKPEKLDHRPEHLEKMGYVKTGFLVHLPWNTVTGIIGGNEVIAEVVHGLRLWFKIF